MELSITLSANAGVSVQTEKASLWVDALPGREVVGFSGISPAVEGDLQQHPAFQNPDYVVFTHCHEDHFSQTLAEKYRAKFPAALFALPEDRVSQAILISGQLQTLTKGEDTVTFYRFPHEGKQYSKVLHYGLIARLDGWKILFAGDCETGSESLKSAIANEKIDVAVLPFPWLTLNRGRAFLEENFQGCKFVFCHLPFACDDVNGYREVAEKALKNWNREEAYLLQEPLQKIVFQK